jgi:hypothetical protein
VSAVAPPNGTLAVANGTYTNGTFTTRVNGNALELLYKPLTAPKGTVLLAQ